MIVYFYQFTKCKVSDQKSSKSHQYLVLLPFAFKPASILIGTLATSQGTLRIVDAVVGQGNLVQQMKNTSSLFPFEIGRCPAVPSAQNWQKPVGPRYTHLLSREVWPEVVFMEELQPKSHTSDIETRPSDSTMHKNIGTGVQKNGSRCSGLMTQNFKYLPVAEDRLFA